LLQKLPRLAAYVCSTGEGNGLFPQVGKKVAAEHTVTPKVQIYYHQQESLLLQTGKSGTIGSINLLNLNIDGTEIPAFDLCDISDMFIPSLC
jgi:hypothetical protein